MDADEVRRLKNKAVLVRKMTIECIGLFGNGHIGGSLSMVEILTILYYREMKGLDPSNTNTNYRDILILSKGHGSPALYAVLADKGFIEKSLLTTLNKDGGNLPSHCVVIPT